MFITRINILLQEKSFEENRDVTQEELGNFVGVSRQVISTWASKNGVKTINAEHVAKVCEFFGIPEGEYHTLYLLRAGEESEESEEKEIAAA